MPDRIYDLCASSATFPHSIAQRVPDLGGSAMSVSSGWPLRIGNRRSLFGLHPTDHECLPEGLASKSASTSYADDLFATGLLIGKALFSMIAEANLTWGC